ncbi:hypothetical protein [Corynebacterium nasicanis]|uniref:DUF559 domain-containing protein n=1 Tax=Corynebacterium nasicanis TaxID=1448267 RepID=A0ABW1QHE1_9CORY
MSELLRKFISPMRDWQSQAGLIVIPRVPLSDREFWRHLAGGYYRHLCPEVVIPRSTWAELPGWQRDEVRIQAVGMSADKAVLVGRSAARVHGLPVPGRDEVVELNLPGKNLRPPRKQWAAGVRYWSGYLPAEQMTVVNGLRVTTIHRTLLDLARHQGMTDAIVACDAALSMPDVSREFVAGRLAALGPVPGIRKLRRVLELADDRSESPLESWARAQIITADLPELRSLEVQVPVLGGKFRIDQVLNGGIAIELHGDIKYDDVTTGTRAIDQMKSDRERERKIQNEGYTMLHAGYPDLVTQRDGEPVFLGKVRAALRAWEQRAA